MNNFRIVLLFLIVILALPFQVYNYVLEYRKYILVLLHLFMFIDILFNKKFTFKPFGLMFWLVGVISFSILMSFKEETTVYRLYLIQFTAIFFVLIYLDTFNLWKGYIKLFVLMLTVMGVLGTAAFFIGLSGQEPYDSLETESRTLYSYYISLTPVVIKMGDSYIIRFSGFFDEPGRFGYFAMYAFFLAYLNRYKKVYLYLLIVSGLFCMSLAFSISIATFFGMIFFFMKSSFRQKVGLVFATSLFLIFLFNIRQIFPENKAAEQIYYFTTFRIRSSQNEDKIITGDSGRTKNLKVAYKTWLENPLLGVELRDIENVTSLFANLMYYPATHGLIGALALYFMLFYLIAYVLIRIRSKLVYIILFIMLINMYQRPNFTTGYIGYLIIPTMIFSIRRFCTQNSLMTFSNPTTQIQMT